MLKAAAPDFSRVPLPGSVYAWASEERLWILEESWRKKLLGGFKDAS